jgi:hypothetical protein
LVPVSVTVSPEFPTAGLTFDSVGAPAMPTVKEVELVAVIPPTVTLIGPVVAAAGTFAVKTVVLAVRTVAVVPLNFTTFEAGVALKPVP